MIIPMKTLFDNCLTYEQLESYSHNSGGKEERAQQYMHISTCELCACAVNGFTAVSFTSAEVDAIKHQIDLRTNATHANPLTFVQALIGVVSVVSIFAFYNFVESFAKIQHKSASVEHVFPITVLNPLMVSESPVAVVSETAFKKLTLPVEKIEGKKIFIPVEAIERITTDLVAPIIKVPEVFIEEVYNADVIYIYDLKVTAYNDLYFNYHSKAFDMKGHTPSFKENKESENYLIESESDHAIAADRILKSGLAYFGKEKYGIALEEFQMLLASNPSDVNALFYSAMSFYRIGKYNKAVKNFEAVLKHSNNVFHPEAKWNLALANLKAGENVKAKQLLDEIVSEKGFYSKRAAEKLKNL